MPTPPKHPLAPLDISIVEIGLRLMAIRKAKGLTQTQLAEKIGITQHVLSNYEIGRRSMSVDMLIRFSLALESSIDLIIGFNQADTVPPLSLKLMHRLKQIELLPADKQKKVLQNLENILDMALPAAPNEEIKTEATS